MAAFLQQLIVAYAMAFAGGQREHEQCGGCSLATEMSEAENGLTGFASLLQSRRNIEPAKDLPKDEVPMSPAPLGSPATTPTGVDKLCVVGGSCSVAGIPSGRSVCVARPLGHNECWDVCNVVHPPSDYQTGNVVLDITVIQTVQAIRNGKNLAVSCREAAAKEAGTKEAGAKEAVAKEAGAKEDERAESVAITASLDEAGYRQVATLKSNSAMEAYIRRVVSNTGCRVADESQLEGVVPFYSGESSTQTYANLEAEVFRACTGTDTWLTSLYSRSMLTAQNSQGPLSAEAEPLGSTAALNEQGFQEVVRMRDDLQMLKYVRRVVGMLRGWVVDESGLHGLLPFFDGEKSEQTLGALILEIETSMGEPDSWVMKSPESLRQLPRTNTSLAESSADLVPGTPLTEEDKELRDRLNEIATKALKGSKNVFQECPEDDPEELRVLNHTAWAVPLDEQGYEAMVQLKSDCAMMQFTLRIVDDLHCHVLDESGLKGMVPFYSGRQGLQDVHELRTELQGTCSMGGKWLVPDVKYWAEQSKDDAYVATMTRKSLLDVPKGQLLQTRASLKDKTDTVGPFMDKASKVPLHKFTRVAGRKQVSDKSKYGAKSTAGLKSKSKSHRTTPKAPLRKSTREAGRKQASAKSKSGAKSTAGLKSKSKSHSKYGKAAHLLNHRKVDSSGWLCRSLKIMCP